MTGTLIDGLLWLVTLGVSIVLARQVMCQRDLAARLFLGMILAIAIHQILALGWYLSIPLARLFPEAVGADLPARVRQLWPIDIGAIVIFACLTLHLFLVFPTQSRLLRRWGWSILLVYVPGLFLALLSVVQALMPLLAGTWSVHTIWPQVFFATAVAGLAIARLLIIYFVRATPRVQQQLTWLLWGLGLSCGMVLVIYALPAMVHSQALANVVPGLGQLPILVLLSAFAVSMQRYQVFDVGTIISRSLVYSTLVILLTLLYLAIGSFLSYLLGLLLGDQAASSYTVTIVTALVITLVALPLRDAIQHWVDRLFFRQRTRYQQTLEDFTRLLTTRLELPSLLDMVASQIEEVFYPLSLTIILGREESGYRVALSRGRLAVHRQWRAGARFASDSPIPARLATLRRPLSLVRPSDVLIDAPEVWEEAEAAGVRILIPMHIRSKLAGWFVLGPKLAELPYTLADLNFLRAVADQSSVALENARLYGEMQQRAAELAMLATVSSAISSSLDLEQVLNTIVESVVKVVDCDKSAIFELSEDGQYLNLRLARGLSPAYVERAHKLKVGINNRTLAVTTQEPLIIPNVQEEPRMKAVLDVISLGGYCGLVDVPLTGREGILGVLSVFFDHIRYPTASELELLTTLANQAAVAIENARLYATVMQERDRATQLYERTDAALARRVEELTAIEQIGRQLTATLDLQRVMDVVLERMVQATQADRGVISLYDEGKHTIWQLAQVGYPPELNRYRTEPWPDDMGITGRVARTATPALIADVSKDPDYVAGADTTQAQISVPVVHKGQVIGIVTAESDHLGAFGVEHLRFAELLADHAAIGINNAQLFQQVMEGRDRLEAILNSTRDAVMFIDNSGRLLLTNRRVRALLGAEMEAWLWSVDLIGEAGTETSPIYRWTDLHAARLFPPAGGDRPGEEGIELAFHLQAGKEKRYLELTASSVLSSSEQTLGWVAVVRDMTHQEELEQFREDLTSMVVHNLQGPLAAVIGSLETLQEFEELPQDMADELLRIALESGRKLYARIESLLWLRRLEESKMPLDLQSLPLPGIVQNVIEEYLSTSTRVGVAIETDLALDLPWVMVDEEVIGRVFSNLLDNALKYTPSHGRIDVRAHLSNSSSTSWIICAVADTGPGISPTLQGTIFGKFRRADENWLGRRKGMGIGLHFCKLAVEAHGGRIWVESKEGKGSTFYFTLPVQHER
ncbi:MAG: GAF domain-containing protein [Anaerolineae bacterium]|nr:GAF domain-containing protein [Anaerolineae bacterium]